MLMEILFITSRKNKIRIVLSLFVLISFLQSCKTTKVNSIQKENIVGVYFLKSDKLYQALSDKNYSSLEIHKDGTYKLNKAEVKFTPVIKQCDYASKGKWSVVADNVIEITSEDYYSEQKGFDYEIEKENKFSQDSLYIQVVFPEDFQPPVKLRFGFNYQEVKILENGETFIALPKSEYLWNRRTATNQIIFTVDANILGVYLYKSRINFPIFEDSIDTEKYNYLTITLPNFDKCFFEFEPYYQELIYLKNTSKILWQGAIWKKGNVSDVLLRE